MSQTDSNLMERLKRAVYPADANAPDGDWYVRTPGGTGGTSTTDNSTFTPGSSSVTPVGGYYGGRTVGSGKIAALAIDGSGILEVNVVAGGAGGGIAQLQVHGSDGAWHNVGEHDYAVPVAFSGFYPTINLGNPQATVNIANALGIFGSVVAVGSVRVTPAGDFTAWLANAPTNPLATVGVYGSVSVIGSVRVTPAETFTVNVVNGMRLVGTANDLQPVGYPSGGVGWNVPMMFGSGVFPTVNIGNGISGTVFIANAIGVYGSVSINGSINVTPVVTVTVSLVGPATVNIGNPTVNIGNGLTATVVQGNIPTVNLGLGTVNIGNNVAVDTSNGKSPTMFMIKASTGGVTLIASGLYPMKVYGIKLITDATVDVYLQSASGNAIEGTMRLLPGAGFAENTQIGSPLYLVPSGLYICLSGAANVGGVVRGYN